MSMEDMTLGPDNEIKKAIAEFSSKVPIWSVTAYTLDGYIIGHKMSFEGIPEGIEQVISSMSSGLITIAEDFIRLIDGAKQFGQLLVDAKDDTGNVTFSIILRHAAENVLLTCIFPHHTPLGLVTFEIEALCQDISEIVGNWSIKVHEDTLT
jgi:predicted regulator of Ras-like GTPase activity (Roadblock/LC7/MglB family)